MTVLWRVVRMALRHPIRLSIAYVAMLGGVLSSMALPFLFGAAIDLMVEVTDVVNAQGQVVHEFVVRDFTLFGWGFGSVAFLGVSITAVSLGRGLCDCIRAYFTQSMSNRVAFDFRELLYDKLQNAGFAFHDRERAGDLMSRATDDVGVLQQFTSVGSVQVLGVTLRILAIPAVLLATDWQLALVVMSFAPAVTLRLVLITRIMRRQGAHVQALSGRMAATLREILSGMQLVKASASEERERERYDHRIRELQTATYDAQWTQGSNGAWTRLHFSVAVGVVLWFGSWLVARGGLSPGELVMFLLYLNQLNAPVQALAQMVGVFSNAAGAGQRVFSILDARSEVEERVGAKDLGRVKGSVRFECVGFAYANRSSSPVLHGIDLEAKPGQVIAILGAPGSGKTTVANLLPRFYDVTSGRITIDGVDIRDLTLQSLRRNVGIVHQDAYLFRGTIRDNIAYGVKDAAQDDFVHAAKVAQLHDQIMSLPNGYDTWVGERGVTLSGGQRQRLSIARTILIDPPVLILDDSTSSVDVETEGHIHHAIAKVMKGRTTFVIAHRLSTIREADQILVLDRGTIVERGTHEELVQVGSVYQGIYDSQQMAKGVQRK